MLLEVQIVVCTVALDSVAPIYVIMSFLILSLRHLVIDLDIFQDLGMFANLDNTCRQIIFQMLYEVKALLLLLYHLQPL